MTCPTTAVYDGLPTAESRVPLGKKIRFFGETSDLPLTIGLIVDVSDSQASFYKQHHQHVEKFLKDVLGPQDQAFLVCFGNHIRLVSDLTPSVSQIMDSFQRFEHERNPHFPELMAEYGRQANCLLKRKGGQPLKMSK